MIANRYKPGFQNLGKRLVVGVAKGMVEAVFAKQAIRVLVEAVKLSQLLQVRGIGKLRPK
ncbi:MAG: hypothetical protein ABL985_19125 [Casimicrobium sp.]